MAGLASPAELSVLQRDGQPLTIVYRKDRLTQVNAAYEQAGTGGNRLVALIGGKVELLDEQRFLRLTGDGR